MNYGVIGSGAMGLALANVLANNDKKVFIYGRNPAEVEEINKFHTNKKYLNDTKLDGKIKATNDIKEVIDFADSLIIAVPTSSVISVIKEINKYLNKPIVIINASKGLDINTNEGMQSVIYKHINKDYLLGIISLLGPGFAKEIIEKNITLICAVSENEEIAKKVQLDFSNDYFRVYLLDDINGAEIGSAMKNAIAIASGILKGLGYGENSKAALITRGLIEINKVGKIFNSKESTFLGLTGVGDLILTCNTFESRNFKAGYEIGLKDDAKEFLNNNKMTVEGIYTIKVIYEIAKKNNLDLPIIDALYQVLYLYEKPSLVVKNVMNRPLKKEQKQ